MLTIKRSLLLVVATSLCGIFGSSQAVELLHFIEAKDYARVIKDATGLKIADNGAVYVTSEEQGTLLKIVDGNIEAIKLSPDVFKDSDLGGIDILADGRLVIVNEGSAQVGILDDQLQLANIFAQSGGSPGELSSPRPVAVSINNNIYVGDVKNKRISVYNHQGLYLQSFGKHGSGGADLLRPTHVSIDAEENVYVLEGPARLSIFNRGGELIERFKQSQGGEE